MSARSLCTCLEREGEQTRKSDRRDLLKWTSFACLFFRCPARRWPVRNELFFINGVVDGTSGERFLTITFRISPVKYRVYFLVVCLFFPRSRIDFQKNLDEKHKKQTACPYVDRHISGEAQFVVWTKYAKGDAKGKAMLWHTTQSK